MREVFADTGYWIAVISPKDDLHHHAGAVSAGLGPHRIVTSDMVLAEVLATFCKDPYLRKVAATAVKDITDDPTIEVVPQTRRLFQEAFELYEARSDKRWSLTDCASFVIMRKRGITEALAYDEHFEQANFVALLRK